MLKGHMLRCGRCVLDLCLVLLLVACQNPRRGNPLDPKLTPPVQGVSVTVDEINGVATVQWNTYEGQQPFAAYWVFRKVKGFEAVDTLTVIPDVHVSTFQDTALQPDLDYEYWITVENQGGLRVKSNQVQTSSFSVSGSPLLDARTDSLKGTVSLRWGQYRGPRFERYAVYRRRFGEALGDTLDTFMDPSDTIWVDTEAMPETDYLYSVITFAADRD